jgi:environmental stress-induced protein Ves
MGLVRVTMQREGKGVHVNSSIEPIDHLRSQRSPLAFSGKVLMRAGLIGWDCHGLLVMARRHVCQVAPSVSRAGDFPSPALVGMQAALPAVRQLQTDAANKVSALLLCLARQTGLCWTNSPLTSCPCRNDRTETHTAYFGGVDASHRTLSMRNPDQQ